MKYGFISTLWGRVGIINSEAIVKSTLGELIEAHMN